MPYFRAALRPIVKHFLVRHGGKLCISIKDSTNARLVETIRRTVNGLALYQSVVEFAGPLQ